MINALRVYAAKIATTSIALALYFVAVPRDISADERGVLAASLRLDATYLQPADNGQRMRTIRAVHPSLQRIDAWISSVGAGAALSDIAGSGLPADICLVDPRNDSVSVLPAPGTGPRFRAFALPNPSEGYDPNTLAPMGCLPADVNEDGRMDLVVYYWGRTPVIFLRNDAPALSAVAFTPVEIAPEREIWNTNAAMLADIDGDGHPDLVFGNYFRDGDRVLDPRTDTGFEMQHSMSRAYNAGRNRLLLWQGSTTTAVSYRDASDAFTREMADGWTLALAARDLDADLMRIGGENLAPYRHLPEIYVANDFGPDRLLLNRSTPGHPRFEIVEGTRDLTTPRSKVLGQDSFKGMGVDFGDVVGDGRPAIAVSNISSPYALLESHFLFTHTGDPLAWTRGTAPYRDDSYKRGTWTSNWAWDIKFADLLNSGRPVLLQAIGFVHGDRNRWPELQELAMGNDELLSRPSAWPRFSSGDELSGRDHDRLFVPDTRGKFHDVWPLLGLDRGTVSRGIATGDVFGDGRLAVVIARQWSPSLFLSNSSAGIGRAIVLDLRVPGAVAGTRSAIGAEARLRLPADGRIVTSTVDGGSGHGGKRAPEIHLGVGQVADNELFNVQLSWRDANGEREQIVEVTPGRHTIVLGAGDCVQSSSVANSTKGFCRVRSVGQ
ncbi:CRTAC1 family protein [Bradyrhizobium liaoningense]|uniref:CRTAC1 family protein n=1 Tax=Bradyrhizobium liaoningense TaxID=43992 RepID=UPI001BAB9D32|nr:CRTAC1 family protein [Bradyrhizobium liaoningense]MBR1031473.1 CRTAC1 family protein [Bradyrhizobium liaoningense]